MQSCLVALTLVGLLTKSYAGSYNFQRINSSVLTDLTVLNLLQEGPNTLIGCAAQAQIMEGTFAVNEMVAFQYGNGQCRISKIPRSEVMRVHMHKAFLTSKEAWQPDDIHVCRAKSDAMNRVNRCPDRTTWWDFSCFGYGCYVFEKMPSENNSFAMAKAQCAEYGGLPMLHETFDEYWFFREVVVGNDLIASIDLWWLNLYRIGGTYVVENTGEPSPWWGRWDQNQPNHGSNQFCVQSLKRVWYKYHDQLCGQYVSHDVGLACEV